MGIGPEDILQLGIRYLPSLALSITLSVALWFATKYLRRPRSESVSAGLVRLFLACAPVICWFVYAFSTYQLSYTLVMLGSESSNAAQWAYENRFKQQVHTVRDAVRLATDTREEPNVRFYAACRIADMVSTNDDIAVNKVLQDLRNGAIITTQFFGGNSLTEGFYVPGHEQVELAPGDIVERRLRLLRGLPR